MAAAPWCRRHTLQRHPPFSAPHLSLSRAQRLSARRSEDVGFSRWDRHFLSLPKGPPVARVEAVAHTATRARAGTCLAQGDARFLGRGHCARHEAMSVVTTEEEVR